MSNENLILRGRYQEAARRTGKKDPARVLVANEATGVRDSIVAHMCLGRFADAASMADGMVSRFPREVSWDYMYAGMIRWFQRKPKAAAAIWKDGLTCGYTFYHGLDCALLLWYASVRRKSIAGDVAIIERMKKPYFRSLRAGCFIDAVVRYIFDEIDEAEARRRAREEAAWEHTIARHLAQLEFYIALKAYSQGNRRQFQKHMTSCASAEGLHEVIPELLVARYEVGMLPFQFSEGEYKAEGHPTKMALRRRVRD
jgi:hypothetical protein